MKVLYIADLVENKIENIRKVEGAEASQIRDRIK